MKYLSESSFVDYNDLIRAGITKDNDYLHYLLL